MSQGLWVLGFEMMDRTLPFSSPSPSFGCQGDGLYGQFPHWLLCCPLCCPQGLVHQDKPTQPSPAAWLGAQANALQLPFLILLGSSDSFRSFFLLPLEVSAIGRRTLSALFPGAPQVQASVPGGWRGNGAEWL